MAISKETIKHLQDLNTAAGVGKLVIFVGAGASASSGVPLWGELIEKFLKKLTTTQKDYLKLAQMYENEFGRTQLIKDVKGILKDKQLVYNSIHEKIFELAPKHVITTNYDDFLETCAQRKKAPYEVIRQDKDIAFRTLEPLIVKMHGCFSIDDLVLTENDYLHFPNKNPWIYTFLKSLFGSSTVLFIGYSLSDWNVKEILHFAQTIHGNHAPKVFLFDTNNNHQSADKKYFERKNIVLLTPEDIDSSVNKKQEHWRREAIVEFLDFINNEEKTQFYNHQIKDTQELPELLNNFLEYLKYYFTPFDEFVLPPTIILEFSIFKNIAYQYRWNLYWVDVEKNNYLASNLTQKEKCISRNLKHLFSYIKIQDGKARISCKYSPEIEKQEQELTKYLKRFARSGLVFIEGLGEKGLLDFLEEKNREPNNIEFFFNLDWQKIDNDKLTEKTLFQQMRDAYTQYLLGNWETALKYYTEISEQVWQKKMYLHYYICIKNIDILERVTRRKYEEVEENIEKLDIEIKELEAKSEELKAKNQELEAKKLKRDQLIDKKNSMQKDEDAELNKIISAINSESLQINFLQKIRHHEVFRFAEEEINKTLKRLRDIKEEWDNGTLSFSAGGKNKHNIFYNYQQLFNFYHRNGIINSWTRFHECFENMATCLIYDFVLAKRIEKATKKNTMGETDESVYSNELSYFFFEVFVHYGNIEEIEKIFKKPKENDIHGVPKKVELYHLKFEDKDWNTIIDNIVEHTNFLRYYYQSSLFKQEKRFYSNQQNKILILNRILFILSRAENEINSEDLQKIVENLKVFLKQENNYNLVHHFYRNLACLFEFIAKHSASFPAIQDIFQLIPVDFYNNWQSNFNLLKFIEKNGTLNLKNISDLFEKLINSKLDAPIQLPLTYEAKMLREPQKTHYATRQQHYLTLYVLGAHLTDTEDEINTIKEKIKTAYLEIPNTELRIDNNYYFLLYGTKYSQDNQWVFMNFLEIQQDVWWILDFIYLHEIPVSELPENAKTIINNSTENPAKSFHFLLQDDNTAVTLDMVKWIYRGKTPYFVNNLSQAKKQKCAKFLKEHLKKNTEDKHNPYYYQLLYFCENPPSS